MSMAAAAVLRSRLWRRTLRRAVRRHRRSVLSLCVLLCLLCSLESLAPAAPTLVPVLVAAADLTSGQPLKPSDLRLARLPPAARPAGSLDNPAQAEGRLLAAPLRRGEPVTDVRLIGTALVDALGPGMLAVPVRVADAASVTLVQPGDRVDLVAAPVDPTGQPAAVVAAAVRVLSVPTSSSADGQGSSDGALLVVAASQPVALALAGAATADRLSLSLLP